MADKQIEITNCHVHLFTERHTPEHYPSRLVAPVKRFPWLAVPIAWLLAFLGLDQAADQVRRLRRFQAETRQKGQRDILVNICRHYPGNTRFVVLPMDLTQIGHGDVPVPLSDQHDELAALKRDPDLGAKIIPFAMIDPRAPGQPQELWRALDRLNFKGIKLYPRLGYAPDHPMLMAEVYPKAEAQGLPIMSHCSRGGVQGRSRHDPATGTTMPMNAHYADLFTEPQAFAPVMKAFPALRICLAHFGGSRDWRAYVNPEAPSPRADEYTRNWQRCIRDMIGSGEHPGLWTDISYTLFDFEENIPFLKHFLLAETDEAERLRLRVLFGSDFYMTRQEQLSERAVCFRLRNELGEEVFRQIAEENPRVWLGEAKDRLGHDTPAFASGR